MGAEQERRRSKALVTVNVEFLLTTHTGDDENFAFILFNIVQINQDQSDTGNYLPSGPDIEIDDSQYTYGPRKSQPSESESQTADIDTFSTASANERLSISDTTNSQEDDSKIPPLEDIHEDTTDGIFTHSSYDEKVQG
ncbi:hypothetical protein Tco_0172749 [Tanacetum coccineum]